MRTVADFNFFPFKIYVAIKEARDGCTEVVAEHNKLVSLKYRNFLLLFIRRSKRHIVSQLGYAWSCSVSNLRTFTSIPLFMVPLGCCINVGEIRYRDTLVKLYVTDINILVPIYKPSWAMLKYNETLYSSVAAIDDTLRDVLQILGS